MSGSGTLLKEKKKKKERKKERKNKVTVDTRFGGKFDMEICLLLI